MSEKQSVSTEECHLGYCNPFSLCFAAISNFCACYSARFSPDMVSEFLYPLYVYHFIYP
jgi:hypothetical protein